MFSDKEHRQSLPFHESFARRLPELLRRAPEIGAVVEICVRRCFFGDAAEIRDGFYFTLYVKGYGDDETAARKNWAIGTKLVETRRLRNCLFSRMTDRSFAEG